MVDRERIVLFDNSNHMIPQGVYKTEHKKGTARNKDKQNDLSNEMEFLWLKLVIPAPQNDTHDWIMDLEDCDLFKKKQNTMSICI